VALNSLPGVVNFRNQFKDDKFKSPKAHTKLSLHANFRNAEAKGTQPHWRTLKKERVAQTSVASLLKIAKPANTPTGMCKCASPLVLLLHLGNTSRVPLGTHLTLLIILLLSLQRR